MENICYLVIGRVTSLIYYMGDFFMKEFIVLIGEIFFISCVQTLVEVFLNIHEKSYQSKILNTACFCASLYLLLQYVFDNIIKDLVSYINFNF